MKRLIIFFILSFLLFPNMGLFSDSMDFVIMVDTSESIFPYFPDIMNYLIKDIITGNLHTGDTFHLLNFAGKPEVDISEKIKDEKTVENILKKLLLLQPLGKYTDLVRAVKFLYQYTKELPENTEKNILLITDGIHDPPPDSPYKYNSSKILKELLQNMQEIKKEGWSIHIMQFPKAINETAGSKKSFLPEISKAIESPVIKYSEEHKNNLSGQVTGFPSLKYPRELGKVKKYFKLPLTITNYDTKPLLVKLEGILLSSSAVSASNVLRKTINVKIPALQAKTFSVLLHIPSDFPKGENTYNINFVFNDNLRISPSKGNISFNFSGGIGIYNQSFLYVLYTILALVLLFLFIKLFLYLKNRISDLTFSEYMHTAKKGPGKPIEMRVSFQNPYIGFRNIHTIKAGSSKSVGGGSSAFLIFLVNVPPKIAEIINTGNKYIFIPVKKEFFPSLQGEVINCLNTDISVKTLNGYEMTLKFHEYVSPLEKINKLMHSIDNS